MIDFTSFPVEMLNTSSYLPIQEPIKAIQVEKSFCIEGQFNNKLYGKKGDYLIVNRNGEKKICDKDEFENKYISSLDSPGNNVKIHRLAGFQV